MDKQIFKLAVILMYIIIFLVSCDKDENDRKCDIQIDKIIVNNYGEFPFQDSLMYVVSDILQYEIKIGTEPANADVYYSKNTNDFIKLSGKWIPIDSTFKKLRFYAHGKNFNKTGIHELNFGFGNDSIISNVFVYPNPFVDKIYYSLSSKYVRGGYYYSISSISGIEILTQDDFISADETQKKINTDALPPGVYIIQFVFGNTEFYHRIVKR